MSKNTKKNPELFEEREQAKFENWFRKFAPVGANKEHMFSAFFGRALLARKGQNDPSVEKDYLVYFDSADSRDPMKVRAYTPQQAVQLVQTAFPHLSPTEARRPRTRK